MSTSVTIDYQDKTTSALLLGSGELGKEVAIELIRYGIEVTACDRYDNGGLLDQERAAISYLTQERLF